MQFVVAVAAMEDVVTAFAEEAVESGATVQAVVAIRTLEDVVAIVARQAVVAGIAVQMVGTGATGDVVGTIAAAELIVVGAAVERVIPAVAPDHVVAAIAVDRIGAMELRSQQGRIGVAENLVGAVAAEDRVGSTQAEDDVVACATVDQVGAVQAAVDVGVVADQLIRVVAAEQHVATAVAVQVILTGAAIQVVAALPGTGHGVVAAHDVGAVAADEDVIPVVAGELVVARAAIHVVAVRVAGVGRRVAATADQDVVLGAAEDDVVAAAAADRVGARAAVDHVVAVDVGRRGDRGRIVEFRVAVDAVVAVAAVDDVVVVAAVDGIVTGAALDLVVAFAAEHDVGPRARIDDVVASGRDVGIGALRTARYPDAQVILVDGGVTGGRCAVGPVDVPVRAPREDRASELRDRVVLRLLLLLVQVAQVEDARVVADQVVAVAAVEAVVARAAKHEIRAVPAIQDVVAEAALQAVVARHAAERIVTSIGASLAECVVFAGQRLCLDGHGNTRKKNAEIAVGPVQDRYARVVSLVPDNQMGLVTLVDDGQRIESAGGLVNIVPVLFQLELRDVLYAEVQAVVSVLVGDDLIPFCGRCNVIRIVAAFAEGDRPAMQHVDLVVTIVARYDILLLVRCDGSSALDELCPVWRRLWIPWQDGTNHAAYRRNHFLNFVFHSMGF